MSYYPSKGFTVKQNSIQMYVISLWIWTLYLNGLVSNFFSQNCRIIIFGNHRNPHKILIEMAAFLYGIKRSLAFLRISSISYFLDKVWN